MFGRIRIRPIFLRGERSRAWIASGRFWNCQDWTCPARDSCKRHWGRSYHYAAMKDPKGGLVVPDRDEGEDSCEHYERDRARKWLMS